MQEMQEKICKKELNIKGNIKLKKELLNKYSNLEEIFKKEDMSNKNSIKLNLLDIDIKNKKSNEIYHIATEIFNSYHNKKVFINNKNKIQVTNQDIKESINKIFNDRLQNIYLKEHLSIFSKLGVIIENAKLVNQTIENKNRSKYITWNYYFSNLKINDDLFLIEFDVVSRVDGENHYRVQRIEKSKYSVNSSDKG